MEPLSLLCVLQSDSHHETIYFRFQFYLHTIYINVIPLIRNQMRFR